MKRLIIGILAHVDAGKTTLAESLLYHTGSIRRLGRVDHKDTFLDTYELERSRGITIFSKQAEFKYKDMEVTLLDTPGHVDFSAEMERTLQVLDYAILVISGSDGVQGHTLTLWKLLLKYKIPTFLFVNKMDIEGTNQDNLMNELKKQLNDSCVNFNEETSNHNQWLENIAVCDELLLESFMDDLTIETEDIISLIQNRKIFPCYFGSGLRQIGINELLNGIFQYTKELNYSKDFAAKVYKIVRDEQGNRLTYMKITGGSLKVKMQLSNEKITKESQELKEQREIWLEKVDQIRIYSGTKYESVDEAVAGMVCAVTGLSKTYPGEGLGMESVSDMPILRPVLNYKIQLPAGCDPLVMLSKLRLLEEEDPMLRILWSEQLKEIHVQLMGEVQIEILKSLIANRFGVHVEFGTGNIVYKETIVEPVIGVGHFEPLRHYAEVHLLLEPSDRGTGLSFYTNCSEDILDRNWQRLILTHLEEKEHTGVLTGSTIIDMKITLLTGRAHIKHTEGGDFRQATYRALRQGLRKSKSILLEPYYNFKLEVPSEYIGRAMSDMSRMQGQFEPPEVKGDMSTLVGYAPVALMQGYYTEVISYTRGRGKLQTNFRGYEPCHNEDEVIASIGYDCDRDIDNPSSSVFCTHGAGFIVEWDKVDEYKHLESELEVRSNKKDTNLTSFDYNKEVTKTTSRHSYLGTLKEDKELEAIFERTFGPIKQKRHPSSSSLGYERTKTSIQPKTKEYKEKVESEDYLLVDGYNIIFAWDELSELARDNIDAARYKLMDILCNYQGFKKCKVILVFDAYKVKGGLGDVQDYNNIHVVYTKEAETADTYIEKITHQIAKTHKVTVATSDGLEQLIIMGQGAQRLSANDLKEEIKRIVDQIRKDFLDKHPTNRNYIGKDFGELLQEFMDDKK